MPGPPLLPQAAKHTLVGGGTVAQEMGGDGGGGIGHGAGDGPTKAAPSVNASSAAERGEIFFTQSLPLSLPEGRRVVLRTQAPAPQAPGMEMCVADVDVTVELTHACPRDVQVSAAAAADP